MAQILHPKMVQPKPRKMLSAGALLAGVRNVFQDIPDHRTELSTISTTDALMSGLAMFGLKFPSLLQFDKSKEEKQLQYNLKTLYGVENIPSDTQMREILDKIDPKEIRPAFNNIFSEIQRGNELKSYQYIDGYYMVSVDGSGYLSSEAIHCDQCCTKVSRNGKVTYYHQLLGAVIVHPDKSAVIPFAPEPISKHDGDTKNDCEQNASKRLLEDIRREHPHLKIIILTDSLSSKGPYIRLLRSLHMGFILGVKPGDHKYLFEAVAEAVQTGAIEEFEETDDNGVIRKYRFINGVSLNKTNSDIKVNFLEYWEINKGKMLHFSWITDLTLSKNNVFTVMRGGRARWKIENETFNTLKKQGYNLGHNYGHGKENLTSIFLLLTMLAFFVDQTQEISCSLFQQAKQKQGSKKSLWEAMRALFRYFYIESWNDLFMALIYNSFEGKLIPTCSQSP